MVQLAMEIPQPSSDDAEAVVTALETAAVFGAQGDTQEALRWVRRAAEAASDEGNDVRALMLARTVADLTTHLQARSVAPGGSASGRITMDPSFSRAASTEQAAPAAAPESERQGEESDAPPPTFRPTSSIPGAAKPAAPTTPVAPKPAWGFPNSGMEQGSPRSPGLAEPVLSAATEAAAPPTHSWDDPALSSGEEGQDSSGEVPPNAALATPIGHALGQQRDPGTDDSESETDPPAAKGKAVGSRQALRVSIAAYPGAPGFFVVRPLEDHQIPGQGAQEALVVLLGTNSNLFD